MINVQCYEIVCYCISPTEGFLDYVASAAPSGVLHHHRVAPVHPTATSPTAMSVHALTGGRADAADEVANIY